MNCPHRPSGSALDALNCPFAGCWVDPAKVLDEYLSGVNVTEEELAAVRAEWETPAPSPSPKAKSEPPFACPRCGGSALGLGWLCSKCGANEKSEPPLCAKCGAAAKSEPPPPRCIVCGRPAAYLCKHNGAHYCEEHHLLNAKPCDGCKPLAAEKTRSMCVEHLTVDCPTCLACGTADLQPPRGPVGTLSNCGHPGPEGAGMCLGNCAYHDPIPPNATIGSPPGCTVDSFSSRGCERGTKGCVTVHGKADPARLDTDGTAKPLTRLVAKVDPDRCVQHPGLMATHYEAENGERVPLAAEADDADSNGTTWQGRALAVARERGEWRERALKAEREAAAALEAEAGTRFVLRAVEKMRDEATLKARKAEARLVSLEQAAAGAEEREKSSIPFDVLRKHYLAHIECDHEKKIDRAQCGCFGLYLPWCPNVGAAIDSWIEHLRSVQEEK